LQIGVAGSAFQGSVLSGQGKSDIGVTEGSIRPHRP
jgi:hypothetical protein